MIFDLHELNALLINSTITILVVSSLTILPCLIVSHILFTIHLKRSKKQKWSRECSCDDPLQRKMYDEGVAWSYNHQTYKRDVQIVNDGMRLYGEYFDFGFDKAVIMVPGRTEGLRYGYYFAKPYAECGYNVLSIDQRAHGESDGTYNTIGFEEHKDIIAWAVYLHDHCHVKSIVLHGICIGASGSLFAMTDAACPSYISALVAEGMYPTFKDSFKNHMVELKKPIFPFLQMVDMWMQVYTGHTMKYGPIHVIDRMQKPILMLHSREDKYSLPETAQTLYDKCACKLKYIVWFDKGAHSQLRITDSDRYDEAIRTFLRYGMEEPISVSYEQVHK